MGTITIQRVSVFAGGAVVRGTGKLLGEQSKIHRVRKACGNLDAINFSIEPGPLEKTQKKTFEGAKLLKSFLKPRAGFFLYFFSKLRWFHCF